MKVVTISDLKEIISNVDHWTISGNIHLDFSYSDDNFRFYLLKNKFLVLFKLNSYEPWEISPYDSNGEKSFFKRLTDSAPYIVDSEKWKKLILDDTEYKAYLRFSSVEATKFLNDFIVKRKRERDLFEESDFPSLNDLV